MPHLLPHPADHSLHDTLLAHIGRHLKAGHLLNHLEVAEREAYVACSRPGRVTPVWQHLYAAGSGSTTGQVLGEIALTQGQLYATVITYNDGEHTTRTTLQALDPSTGAQRWTKILFDATTSSTSRTAELAADAQGVYAHVSGTVHITALEPAGKERFRTADFHCPGGTTNIWAHLTVQGGLLLGMPLGDTCFSAWCAADGAQAWVFNDP